MLDLYDELSKLIHLFDEHGIDYALCGDWPWPFTRDREQLSISTC
ncbi:hypothetical protein BH20ACI3_BH20ACI3_14090 [soil metagenome]